VPSQTVTDTVGSIHGLPVIWGWLRDAVGEDAFATGTPSALDLANATCEVLGIAAGQAVERAATGAGAIDAMATLAPHAAASTNMAAEDADAAALLVGVTQLFHRAGRAVHAAGAGPATHAGRVTQVSASRGGVPKRPVGRAEVNERGLVVDCQAARRHHGKPMQALCLYSSEVIDALRAEGHRIAPGAAGENVTISGLDWSSLRPGVRLRIGGVLAEISAAATPCDKNARWFLDGDYDRMSQQEHPGWSRLYAWVLEPGEVADGDRVTVEP
jgi:MOSC domain-containing protein YiiM